jgi:hypothetical protein
VVNFTDTTTISRSKSATNGGSIQENIKKLVEEQQILEHLNIMCASDKVIKKIKKDSAKMWAELQPGLPNDVNFWIKSMAYGLRGYFVTLNITEMSSGGGTRTGGSGRARAKLEWRTRLQMLSMSHTSQQQENFHSLVHRGRSNSRLAI